MDDLPTFFYEHGNDTAILHYMKEQVWECKNDLAIYSLLSRFEHNQLVPVMPKAPKVVMDLGCGIGRAGIYLNHVLANPDVHFIMADRHGDTPTNTGDWAAGEYYNNLEATAKFCDLNGLHNYQTFDTSAKPSAWSKLPKVDYVMSRCAIGMHIPLEFVLPGLLRCMTPDVTVILGIRAPCPYDEQSFTDVFEEVRLYRGERDGRFPYQDWLVLKGLKA